MLIEFLFGQHHPSVKVRIGIPVFPKRSEETGCTATNRQTTKVREKILSSQKNFPYLYKDNFIRKHLQGNMENNQEKISRLLAEIEAAEHNGSPVDALCVEAIGCLETARQEFLHRARQQGYAANNLRVGEIEIQQLTAMRQLARRGGLPDIYTAEIRQVRVRVLGEELVAANFDE